MKLIEVMRKLYASEINCGIQMFYDGGVEVWLGDDRNGIHARGFLDIEDLDQAAQWLDEQARKHYPDSQYARKLNVG